MSMEKTKRTTKLPLDKFVVGQFVRWRAERFMSDWDCFGVITEVNTKDETFKFRTFDTLKETDSLSFYTGGQTSEFTLCVKRDVVNYIKQINVEIKRNLSESELKISSLRTDLSLRETLLKEMEGL